jgi:hypothetical protein
MQPWQGAPSYCLQPYSEFLGNPVTPESLHPTKIDSSNLFLTRTINFGSTHTFFSANYYYSFLYRIIIILHTQTKRKHAIWNNILVSFYEKVIIVIHYKQKSINEKTNYSNEMQDVNEKALHV